MTGSDNIPTADKYICCPFCDENDFDKEGLKLHLIEYCEAYHNLDISDLSLEAW